MKISKAHVGLLFAFIVITLASRWLPHPPNMTAVGALALMSGALWGRKIWAPLVPLAALVLSDLVLGFHSTFIYVYAGFVLVALMGLLLQPQDSVLKSGFGALASSLIFFAVSNFGVWMDGGLYPKNASGLIECYVMALPFLQNQILGDFIFIAVFVFMARRLLASRPLPQTA